MSNEETKRNLPYHRNSFGRIWKRNISAYRQYRFNRSFVSEFDRRNFYLKGLLHARGLFEIKQPFYCRYGSNIYLGRDFTCGHNAVFEDEAEIRIGDHVQMGNNVKLVTTRAIKDPYMRKQHKEVADGITIGDHVYLGHDVTILAGVTIGSCAIVADGSIVAQNVPEGSIVQGNPAQILEEESEWMAPFERNELQLEEKPGILDQLGDHVNLEKVDFLIHAAAFGVGVVAAYQTTKQMLEWKSEWETKKAMVERYLPVLEKLSNGKECRKKWKS